MSDHFLQVAKLLAVHLVVSAGIVLALVWSVHLDYFLTVNEEFLLVDVAICAWLCPLFIGFGDAVAQCLFLFLGNGVSIGFFCLWSLLLLGRFGLGYCWLLRLCTALYSILSLFSCLVSSTLSCLGFCDALAFCNGCIDDSLLFFWCCISEMFVNGVEYFFF